MVFSTRQTIHNYQFYFGSEIIKIAEQCKYLGIIFHQNCQFKQAVLALKERGNKAMFSLARSLYTGVTFNPSLPLKVFDSTIRPIITYGSEVWSHQYIKFLQKPIQIDKAPFESINNRFCKYVMGLPKQATNFGIKAELGRNPIFSYICAQSVKYWIRLLNLPNDRLLKSAYMSEIQLYSKGNCTWLDFIEKVLEISGIKNIWQNQSNIHGTGKPNINIQSVKTKVVDSITQLYYADEFKRINCNSKLRLYKEFKGNYNIENYVNIYNVPLHYRKLYCAFRLSCHDLEIERGRYARPRISPEKRICKICTKAPETEDHFIIFCQAYSDLRTKMYADIAQIDSSFTRINAQDRFKFLMTTKNHNIIINVMKYIYSAYKIRKMKLSSG